MNSLIDIKAVCKAGHYLWTARYSQTPPVLNDGIQTDLWQFGGSVNYLTAPEIAGQTCDQNYCYTDFTTKSDAEADETKTPETYVVQSGDCLSVIASRLNVDLKELAAVNKIEDINLIYPGQMLIIPGTCCPDSSGESNNVTGTAAKQVYIVQSGDTLWSIAERLYGNGSRYTELAIQNNIADAALIYPGQEIYY